MSFMSSIYRRTSNHDSVQRSDMIGAREDMPYCMINAKQFINKGCTLTDFLHEIPTDREMTPDEAMEDFIKRLDADKQLWRVLLDPLKQSTRYGYRSKSVDLEDASKFEMVNTGITELLVGSRLFAIPAIVPLAKNNDCNLFVIDGKTYIHPMLLGEKERSEVSQDVLALIDDRGARTKTLIGHYVKRGFGLTELNMMRHYVAVMKPIGTIVSNNRNDTSIVRIGGNFQCQVNSFA